MVWVIPILALIRLLTHFNRGTLSYGVLEINKESPLSLMYLFPHTLYIDTSLNLKGCSRVSPLEVSALINGVRNFEYDKVKSILDKHAMYYSHEEFNRFSVLINNSYNRFNDDLKALWSFFCVF